MIHNAPHTSKDLSSEAAAYVLDAEESVLTFKAKAFLLLWVDGTMKAEEGELVLADDAVRARGVVAARSVKTGIGVRDWHLRHHHYLSAEAHPRIALSVDPVSATGGKVPARLSARGNDVNFELEVDAMEISGDTLRARARGSFDRRPLGMLPPIAGVGRVVHLTLDVVAHRAVA
jgi:polyisoprenoid-binding protein YceI